MTTQKQIRKTKIVGVLLFLGILLTFVAVLSLALNPFKRTPEINVVEAYWKTGRSGYLLHLNVSATAPVQLVGMDVGGVFYDVVYDINPPASELEIPTDNIDSKVKLHFNVGSPKDVYPKSYTLITDVRAIYGLNHLFLVGSLAEPATIFVLPIPKETNVLVVTAPNEVYRIFLFLNVRKFTFGGTILDAMNLNMNILMNSTTVVFVDITPEPSLLETLVKNRKAVVVAGIEKGLGERRFDIAKNGSIIVKEYKPDTADIDYLGAHCVLYKRGHIRKTGNNIIDTLISLYGSIDFTYVISPSTYCRKNVAEAYAETELSEVAIAKIRPGFYFISSSFEHILTLASMGFFESESKKATVLSTNPFKGVFPLPDKTQESAYLVTLLTKSGMRTLVAEKPAATYSVQGDVALIEVGIRNNKVVLSGFHRIRIEEYTYDYDLLKVVEEKNLTLPTTLQISYTPFRTYLLYIDGVPSLIISEEAILDTAPSISVEYSAVYELFTLKVSRNDNVPSPLFLSINGRDVFVLDSSNGNYELLSPRTGFFNVVVKDVYGRVIRSVKFQVTHIYETPLFIIAVLSAGASFSTLAFVLRKRTEKEVEEIKMVFYKLPEIERRTIDVYAVEEAISRFTSTQKTSPPLQAVLHDLYRKHPLLKVVDEVALAVTTLLQSRRGRVYGLYSRYMPELDDTITVIGLKSDLKKNFYTHVIKELLKKFGGVSVLGDELRDIVDVDLAIAVGKKMLLVTYAPSSDVRDAIDRGLTSLTKIRRFRLPFTLVGLAIVTEPKYVKAINDILDKILNQDEEVATKILRDMTVYTHHIRTASRDAWLSKYIIVAVPITRLAPLLAFVKTGAVRLCNKYYRILQTA